MGVDKWVLEATITPVNPIQQKVAINSKISMLKKLLIFGWLLKSNFLPIKESGTTFCFLNILTDLNIMRNFAIS